MKHLNPRRLAAGASIALAAGLLVAGTTSGATAAPATTDYTCSATSPVALGPWDVSVVSDIVGIDAIGSASAGAKFPATALDVTNLFTVPTAAHDALVGASADSISVTDYVGSLGTAPVGVINMTALVADMTDNGDGTWSVEVPGKSDAVTMPKAGTYDILTPDSFTMTAVGTVAGDIPVSCVLADGATTQNIHTIQITKNLSTTTASVVKPPVEKGTHGKLNVTVSADNHKPTGKVIAEKGDKKIGSATLSKGKATITLDKLKPGKYKVTVLYGGDGYTTKSRTSVIVKVSK